MKNHWNPDLVLEESPAQRKTFPYCMQAHAPDDVSHYWVALSRISVSNGNVTFFGELPVQKKVTISGVRLYKENSVLWHSLFDAYTHLNSGDTLKLQYSLLFPSAFFDDIEGDYIIPKSLLAIEPRWGDSVATIDNAMIMHLRHWLLQGEKQ